MTEIQSEIIENLIIRALRNTSDLITTGTCNSRIMMPNYRAKTIRYSEQELKQIFLSLIETEKHFYYSVETPSNLSYRFVDGCPDVINSVEEQKEKKYESSRFDVTLYESNDINSSISQIEFKYNNPEVNEIGKDLLKLANENKDGQNYYFVHYNVVQSDSWKTETFPSIMEKYCNAFNIEKIDNTNFDHVWIFLMIVKKKEGDNETSIIKFSLKQLFDDMDRFKKYQF